MAAEAFRRTVVVAIGRFHVYLDHFFKLPFPAKLRPLLRTINVLHLKETAPPDGVPWEKKRDDYIRNRLRDEEAEACSQLLYDATAAAGVACSGAP